MYDPRSIRQSKSMMSGQSQRARKKKRFATGRKNLTDRLAHVPGLSRLSGMDAHKAGSCCCLTGLIAVYNHRQHPGESPVTRPSLLLPSHINRTDSPVSSRAPSPTSLRLPAPNKRFMECAEEGLRVSEVEGLLREYRLAYGLYTIVRHVMHNFHLLLNNSTITTHTHIGSTLLYTLGFCRLGPTRILLFCSEFVAAAAAEVGVSIKQ